MKGALQGTLLLSCAAIGSSFGPTPSHPPPTNGASGPGTDGPVHTLILCRHGDSIWNGGQPGHRETFTGWTNVPLSSRGVKEARLTGREVAAYAMSSSKVTGIDACFTSILDRAKLTAHHCLWSFAESPVGTEPQRFVSDYRLNERHYGALQGLVKAEVEGGLHGHDPEEVQGWRRGWYSVPPLLEDGDERRAEEVRRYGHLCGGQENVPRGESLEMVAEDRIRPFLVEVLTPILDNAAEERRRYGSSRETDEGKAELIGGTGLVVAHANSLRALIGVICNVQSGSCNGEALRKLEAMRIQTGVPLVLRYCRSGDGRYVVCDLPETDLEDELGSTSSSAPRPDLPVWPLSCLPSFKHNDKVGFKGGKVLDSQWNGNFGLAPGTQSDANVAVVNSRMARAGVELGI